MSDQLHTRERDKARVRDASDIVRVVGEHVALRAKGREYVGLCPFHDDHNPSMCVVPHKQIFHCFVCGAGGDVFAFIQRYHSMDFREALTHLAERGGIELSATGGGGDGGPAGTRAGVLEANAYAQAYFRKVLADEALGRSARAVIERRGISEEMVRAFALGASPDRWDGLLTSAGKRGFDAERLADAGLAKRRERAGGHYDAFRNRLMFPIQDQLGRVVAFGARRLNEEDEPKYLNSPDTAAFSKSSTLFGLGQAAKAIQRERVALVTEGYTDVIACHQAGFTNAVATLGTALTREHASTLRRLCDTVILLFDGDEAGQRAADRAVEVFFREPVDVRIATLSSVTDAKDPDELLKRPDGASLFRVALDESADLFRYRFARLRSSLSGSGAAALGNALERELATLADLGLNELPPLRRSLVLRQIAQVAGLDERTVARATPAGRRVLRGREDEGGDAGAGNEPLPGLEAEVLGCVLQDPSLLERVEPEFRDLLSADGYSHPLLRRVAQAVNDLADSGVSPGLRDVLVRLESPEAQQTAVSIAERVEKVTDGDRARLGAHWEACLSGLARRRAMSSRSDDVLESIRLRREALARFGANPTVMPRPRGPGRG